MQFRVVPIANDFLVVDAATTNVGRMSVLLQARRVPWLVVRDGEKYFVFSTKEVAVALAMAPSTLLAAALRLHRVEPSVFLRSAVNRVDFEQKPISGTPASRVVTLKKSANNLVVVSAIGNLKRYVAPTVKATALVKRRSPARTELLARGGAIRSPAKRMAKKKAAAKKMAPVRKAAPKRSRGRSGKIGLSFGFGDSTPGNVATAQPVRKTRSFSVIDVFYGTDREPKSSNSADKIARYLNRLPAKGKLEYGICSVTIPERHTLGKIESPSIWSFEMREDPEKHFTISGCVRRSASVFFKELQVRVAQSSEQSCFVFIHGYSVSFEDAAKRTAQLACDLKFLGAPILYSWASAANWRKYSKDVETVDMTVDSLSRFIAQLAQFSGAGKIHLIAHSMGNRALVKALKQLAVPPGAKPFRQVVLTAPDVPTQNVEPLITAASAKAERVTLYASSKDKALGLSKVKNDYQRLGKVYGFPFVFPGMDSIDATKVKTDFWEHSVFAKARTVLGDLAALIAEGNPPDKRFGLKRVTSPNGVSWVILR